MTDIQKKFMDWLDTCPVVEHRTIENVEEDSATWIYTVDFAVSKEEEQQGTIYRGNAPSTEASFYKKTFVGVSETEYKKSEVEDLDNQSYSEGEEY